MRFIASPIAWPVVFRLMLSLSAVPLAASSNATECTTLTPDGPLQITENCIDLEYGSPVFTKETDGDDPVPHRRISGHFNGTSVDFNIYLPAAHVWECRFFHHVYPVQESPAEDDAIAFGADSGAYTIQASGSAGYRADAALAKLSRKLAAEYYGPRCGRIHGYVYGGSGGSLVTVGAMENTRDVWDGSVTLVQAVPVSNPNNFAIRALAGLVLDSKAEEIGDAVSPGGSGDPFALLDETERAVLEEATALGVPLETWEDFDGVARNRTMLWASLVDMAVPQVRAMDPTYADDFWNEVGYIGAEDSELGVLFRDALISFDVLVRHFVYDDNGVPTEITLNEIPGNINVVGLEFAVTTENASNVPFTGRLDPESGTIFINPDNDSTALAALVNATTIHMDNRWFLAIHGFHRHQVPPVDRDFYGYDHLRDDAGVPRYPQRDLLVAPTIAQSASGGASHSGNITGKVIVMGTLLDYDAFPWHMDWYKSRVRNALGDRFDDNYRLYFSENADHFMETTLDGPMTRRIVPVAGLWEQHLRDLSAWVEEGVAPPDGTRYTVDTDSQVRLPDAAAERGGIQPVVDLTVGGNTNRTQVTVAEPVIFRLRVEVPPGAGEVVSVEWDFKGVGEFAADDRSVDGSLVELEAVHAYDEPGTYIAGARVVSQREGDADTAFARAFNLGRARVIVGQDSQPAVN